MTTKATVTQYVPGFVNDGESDPNKSDLPVNGWGDVFSLPWISEKGRLSFSPAPYHPQIPHSGLLIDQDDYVIAVVLHPEELGQFPGEVSNDDD